MRPVRFYGRTEHHPDGVKWVDTQVKFVGPFWQLNTEKQEILSGGPKADLPAVLLAGGAGSALRHPRPRLQEQRGQHHEAVVCEGAVRVQPERLYVRFLFLAFQSWEG